jgi:RNA polymerase-binding transcription factor
MEITDRLQQDLDDAIDRLKRLAQDVADEEMRSRAAGSESVADIADAAQGSAERDMHFATRSLLQARAKRLAAALERLSAGHYGACDGCGEPIAPARLAALPEVTSCVACQDKREHGRHRRQSHHPLPFHEHRPSHGEETTATRTGREAARLTARLVVPRAGRKLSGSRS